MKMNELIEMVDGYIRLLQIERSKRRQHTGSHANEEMQPANRYSTINGARWEEQMEMSSGSRAFSHLRR